MVSIRLPFISIYWLNREATNYWYTCARAAFNDPDWFVKNHHAVRQAKRKANMTYMKAYQKHGKNTAIDTNKTWKSLNQKTWN